MKKEEVLVIDDNEYTRDIMKLILEGEGLSVSCCADRESAFELIKEKSFEIFVVDYRLPEQTTGDEVVAELRRLFPDSFIIGFSIESKERIFLKAGADKFIIKDHLNSEMVQSIRERKLLDAG